MIIERSNTTIDVLADIGSVTSKELLKLLSSITLIELKGVELDHWEKYLIIMDPKFSSMLMKQKDRSQFLHVVNIKQKYKVENHHIG